MRLTLPLPPLVNRYWRHVQIKGAVRVLLSSEARRYQKAVSLALAGVPTIDYPVVLLIDVYVQRRGTDADACLKSLLDAIEHAGLIRNDNLVCELRVRRYLDATNPRVELEILPVEDPALINPIAPSLRDSRPLDAGLEVVA